MTHTERFIKDCEEVWQNKPPFQHTFVSANGYWAVFKDANGSEYTIAIETILMNPENWKACGKVRGWHGKPCNCGGKIVDAFGTGKNQFPYQCEACNSYLLSMEWEGTWRSNMHRLIDALAEGKTIEQYLETL